MNELPQPSTNSMPADATASDDLENAVIAADDTGMVRSIQITVQTEIGDELGLPER